LPQRIGVVVAEHAVVREHLHVIPKHGESPDAGDERLDTLFWFDRAGELRQRQDGKHRRQAHRSLQATGPKLLSRRRIATGWQ
jgi:hypothetical protein